MKSAGSNIYTVCDLSSVNLVFQGLPIFPDCAMLEYWRPSKCIHKKRILGRITLWQIVVSCGNWTSTSLPRTATKFVEGIAIQSLSEGQPQSSSLQCGGRSSGESDPRRGEWRPSTTYSCSSKAYGAVNTSYSALQCQYRPFNINIGQYCLRTYKRNTSNGHGDEWN